MIFAHSMAKTVLCLAIYQKYFLNLHFLSKTHTCFSLAKRFRFSVFVFSFHKCLVHLKSIWCSTSTVHKLPYKTRWTFQLILCFISVVWWIQCANLPQLVKNTCQQLSYCLLPQNWKLNYLTLHYNGNLIRAAHRENSACAWMRTRNLS